MLSRWRDRLDRLLTFNRARAYALILIGLYLAAWVDVLVLGSPPLNSSGTPIGGDYIAFHTAGRLVLGGQAAQLYDHAAVAAVQDGLLGGRSPGFYDAYRNPPFFALIFVPLAVLDLLPGFAIWSLLSLACLALTVWLMVGEVSWLRARWRGLVVLILAFPPVYFGLIDGENAVLSLFLFALIYRCMVREEYWAAGAWAALGTFKPQLFFVFPLIFLASRRWRAVAAYVVVALALLGVSLAEVGAEGMQAWLRSLLEAESGNATANAWRMSSLKSFFDLLLPGQLTISLGPGALSLSLGPGALSQPIGSGALSLPLGAGGWSLSLGSGLSLSVGSAGLSLSLGLYIAAALVLLALLLRVWSRPLVSLPLTWAFTALIAVLVDPHLVDYDLTVLVSAGALALALVPAVRWWVVLLYPLLLLRVQVPLGDVSLQLAVPVLVWCAYLVRREIVTGRREIRSGPHEMPSACSVPSC